MCIHSRKPHIRRLLRCSCVYVPGRGKCRHDPTRQCSQLHTGTDPCCQPSSRDRSPSHRYQAPVNIIRAKSTCRETSKTSSYSTDTNMKSAAHSVTLQYLHGSFAPHIVTICHSYRATLCIVRTMLSQYVCSVTMRYCVKTAKHISENSFHSFKLHSEIPTESPCRTSPICDSDRTIEGILDHGRVCSVTQILAPDRDRMRDAGLTAMPIKALAYINVGLLRTCNGAEYQVKIFLSIAYLCILWRHIGGISAGGYAVYCYLNGVHNYLHR